MRPTTRRKPKAGLTTLDSDGPMPRKFLRPVKRIPNGADLFYAEHHAEYEARGKQSEDKVAAVHQHNRHFPALHNPLQKRRSLVKVATMSLGSDRDFDPSCSACVKLATLRELANKNVRPRCEHRCKPSRQSERYRHRGRHGISKFQLRKRVPDRASGRFINFRPNRDCHTLISYVNFRSTQLNTGAQTGYHEKSGAGVQTGENSKADVDRDYSVGSFNSFISQVGDEPMVD